MKKILLIIAIIFIIFQMVVLAIAIDIGSVAIDREASSSQRSIVDKANPANGSGTITSVEIWAMTDLTGVRVATFFVVSGNNLSTRDWEIIQIDGQDPGDVPSGSKQTATVDIDVEAGDYIGIYWISGSLEWDTSGGVGLWYDAAQRIPCENFVFSYIAGYAMSVHGTGTTEAPPEEANAIWFGTDF